MTSLGVESPGSKTSSSPIRSWFVRGIGLLLFLLILSRIDYRGATRILLGADPLTLVAAFLLILPMMALKTIRWRRLQRISTIRPGDFASSLLAYMTGMYAGLVTPGRVGEFLRVKHLTDAGAPLGPAMSTVIWDRLIDIAGLLFMGLLALGPLAAQFRGLYFGLLVLTLALAVGIPLVLRGGGRVGVATRSALHRLSGRGGGVGRRLGEIGAALAETLGRIGPSEALVLLGLTLAGWVIYYFQAWLLATTLGIPLGLFPLVVSVTAAAVAAFVPVSISGLGTRDAALVVLLGRFGRPSEEAVALSTLVFLVLVANALLGLLASQWLHRRTRNEN